MFLLDPPTPNFLFVPLNIYFIIYFPKRQKTQNLDFTHYDSENVCQMYLYTRQILQLYIHFFLTQAQQL
jgi:hypothetical protein